MYNRCIDMGRAILYCAECGGVLRDDDVRKGSDQRPYCGQCRPAPPAASPSRRSSRPIPIAGAARPGTTRRSVARPSRAPLAALAGAGGAALVLVLAAAALSSRPRPQPEVAARPSEPPPAGSTEPPGTRAPAPAPSPPVSAPAPPPDPGAALDRWLAEIRKVREKDPASAKAAELRSMFRKAVEMAPPSRRAEVERIAAEYEQSVLPPAPPKADGPSVRGFTLINAETSRPVPGFDPIPEGATIDLSKVGTRRISLRANVAGGKIGCLRIRVDDLPPQLERSAPLAAFGDDQGKYRPWTPSAGIHKVRADLFPGKDPKGEPSSSATLSFTVLDPR